MKILAKAEKEDATLLWQIWTIFAIIMLIGVVIDVDIISSLLSVTDENRSINFATPEIIYYNLLRFIVCGLAIYGLYLTRLTLGIKQKQSRVAMYVILSGRIGDNDYDPLPTWKTIFFSWWFIFLILAIIFNPLIPLHIGRVPWLIIDLIVIALLISSFFLFRVPKTTILCDYCGAILKKGYYHNNARDTDGEFIGDELCIWCVNEMRRLGTIKVDPKEPAIKDEADGENVFPFHCWMCGELVVVDKSEGDDTIECEVCGTKLEIPNE